MNHLKIDYAHSYYNRQSRRDSLWICLGCGIAWLVVVAIAIVAHILRG